MPTTKKKFTEHIFLSRTSATDNPRVIKSMPEDIAAIGVGYVITGSYIITKCFKDKDKTVHDALDVLSLNNLIVFYIHGTPNFQKLIGDYFRGLKKENEESNPLFVYNYMYIVDKIVDNSNGKKLTRQSRFLLNTP